MSHIVTVITLNTKITTAYNFEKSTFPTNDVPNNTCSRPDAVFQVLYFNIIFFISVLPVFIVVKHRRHLGMKGALTKMIKLQVATDQECNCMIRILVIF